MVKYEKQCVNCGLPCIENVCPHMHVPHYYCDECKEEHEVNELYRYDMEDLELCEICLLNKFDTVG